MEEIKRIPQRSEIAVEDTWNTADLYVSDEAWEEEAQLLVDLAKNIEGYKGRLSESATTLLEFMKKSDELNFHQQLF